MSQVELPTLENDEPTLRERLTENAYQNIIPARYLSEGESPEDLFERVAKNVSVAEAVYSSGTFMIEHQHIKPDHPRRDELLDEVFGYNNDPDDDRLMQSVHLDESNAKYVSYDAVVDDLPDEIREDVVHWKEQFQELMERLGFIPNSPTLMNAGDELQQLSACFVMSPEDDITNIHETAKEAAETFQSGGGVGYAFHHLRPYGDRVGSTGGIASGPITFMRTYDQLCETIAQGGARRGAQMGVMKVDHPDIIQFIHAKDKDVSLARTLKLNDPDDFTHTEFIDALNEARELIDEDGKVPEHLRNAVEGHLSNFNISVGVTNRFMEAVKNDEMFTLVNPRNEKSHEVTPETAELWERFGYDVEVGEPLRVPARDLFADICEGAHENGEPGMLFLERANDNHTFDVDEHPEYEMHASNPCGEQFLMEYEACNLGHINLSTLVDEDRLQPEEFGDYDNLDEWAEKFLDNALDVDELNHRINVGVRFLDNVVTMSDFPNEKIEETVRDNRKIGLGIMGLAQMFVQVGVEYGSERADKLAEKLMEHISYESKEDSRDLAKQRGEFGNWEDSKYANPTEYPEWFTGQTGKPAEDWEGGFAMRNHNTMTIAPTGTTSMIGNTSGGCEPIYNVARFKNVSDDVQGDEPLVEFDELFLRTLELNGIDVREVKYEAEEMMNRNEFDGPHDLSIPDEIADLFVTTGQLSSLEHASIQCAIQKHVDSSISKTINAPNEDTVEDTMDAFEYVWDNGAKGITYYRDGTRTKQVLTTRKDNQDVEDEEELAEKLAEKTNAEADNILAFADGEDVLDEETEQEAEKLLDEMEDESAETVQAETITPADRPAELDGTTYRVPTGYGRLYVVVNHLDGRPFEVMATVGKSGGLVESMTEAIARQVSNSLRAGVDVSEVIEQLENIQSPQIAWHEGQQIQSVPDGIAYALNEFVESQDTESESERIESEPTSKNLDVDSVGSSEGTQDKNLITDGATRSYSGMQCRECSSMRVKMDGGCPECEDCGWSKCG